MNWYKVAKQKEFDLSSESRDLWRILLLREMDRVGIHFDTENDDIISSRNIDLEIKQNKDDDESYRSFCEMRIAGGDWQCPNIYFRCQMMYKYKSSRKWSTGYECKDVGDIKEKDFWDMMKKEVENRKKDEWKMYENSNTHDEDIWDVGFARDLLKHWKVS